MTLEDSAGKLILFEIKSSVPFRPDLLKKELLELLKYDEDLIRTDKGGVISKNHDIVFLCPLKDFESVKNMINSLGNGLTFSKSFSIWTWAEINAIRRGATNSIVIDRKIGDVSNQQLNSASDHINIDDYDLIEEIEKSVFVPLQPPDVYLLIQLFSQIFPGIFPQDEKIFIPKEEIIKITKDYYLAWAGNQGTHSQVRSDWIKRGLKLLIDLGLAEKNDKGEYFVQTWIYKRTKDVKKYLMRLLCDRELISVEKEREEKRKAEVAEKQKQLDQFF